MLQRGGSIVTFKADNLQVVETPVVQIFVLSLAVVVRDAEPTPGGVALDHAGEPLLVSLLGLPPETHVCARGEHPRSDPPAHHTRFRRFRRSRRRSRRRRFRCRRCRRRPRRVLHLALHFQLALSTGLVPGGGGGSGCHEPRGPRLTAAGSAGRRGSGGVVLALRADVLPAAVLSRIAAGLADAPPGVKGARPQLAVGGRAVALCKRRLLHPRVCPPRHPPLARATASGSLPAATLRRPHVGWSGRGHRPAGLCARPLCCCSAAALIDPQRLSAGLRGLGLLPGPWVGWAVVPRELDARGDVVRCLEKGALREHAVWILGRGLLKARDVDEAEVGRLLRVVDEAPQPPLRLRVDVLQPIARRALSLANILGEAHRVGLVLELLVLLEREAAADDLHHKLRVLNVSRAAQAPPARRTRKEGLQLLVRHPLDVRVDAGQHLIRRVGRAPLPAAIGRDPEAPLIVDVLVAVRRGGGTRLQAGEPVAVALVEREGRRLEALRNGRGHQRRVLEGGDEAALLQRAHRALLRRAAERFGVQPLPDPKGTRLVCG